VDARTSPKLDLGSGHDVALDQPTDGDVAPPNVAFQSAVLRERHVPIGGEVALETTGQVMLRAVMSASTRASRRVNVAWQCHITDMSALPDRLFDLWLEPVDARDDPEAAFRELYADPVSINGTPRPVSFLVERARALQRAFAGLTTEIVEQVETSDRLAIAFYIRGRHVGPLLTPIGTVAPTGSTVEIRTIDVLTIADGVITALWVVSDELGMLTQLDAVQLA